MKDKKLFLQTGIIICLVIAIISILFINNNKNLNKINQFYKYVVNDREVEVIFVRKFQNYADKNLKEDDYNNLVRGLDKNSKKTVDKILANVKLISSKKHGDVLYLYTNRDLENLSYYYDKISQIKKYNTMGQVIYDYNKMLIPEVVPEKHILVYGCDYKYIKNKKKVRQGDIIDAGAYVGDSSLVLAKYTDKNVYAFEPVLKNFMLLNNTIKLNNSKNIVPVKLGLGDKTEINFINKSNLIPSAASIKYDVTAHFDKEKIDMVKLDDFVKANNLNVSLIKSDIEGFEQELLRGAENTIKTQKPVLVISIYHSADDFFHIKTMIEKWNLGYKFKIVKSKPDNVLLETVLIAEVR